MTISKEQTEQLLAMMASVKPDSLDCDKCFDHMAEFVETELSGRDIPEALRCVQQHLEQCACCNDEHNALLEGLRAIAESDPS